MPADVVNFVTTFARLGPIFGLPATADAFNTSVVQYSEILDADLLFFCNHTQVYLRNFQPVPVDINYSVKIICNRMRELNQLNKIIMQKFSSRQAYTFIKGQYVPIVLQNISDESQMALDSRKYFIQNYDFTMLGYLIDEEEFQVKPAIARVAQIMELDTTSLKRRRPKFPENPNEFLSDFLFISGNDTLSEIVEFRANMSFVGSTNVDSFDVYINDDFYGTDVNEIQITTNDILRIDVVKTNNSLESTLKFESQLV
jgi:hypothetical protein